MLPQRESLPAVTAAGVVAVIFASFGILACGLVMLSLIALPHLPASPGATALPGAMRAMAAAIYGFFMAICIGELIVAINVLRRRNWARITLLVWAGLMVAMSAFGIAAIWLVSSIATQTTPQVPNAGAVVAFLRIFLALFYGIPLGVGIWWLILFTRPRVVAAFQASGAVEQILPFDASGFPAPPVAAPLPTPKKPSVPLPIAIIAAFDVSGAFSMLLILFVPLPFVPPFFLFGVQIPQVPYKVFLAMLGIAYMAFIVGIFRLRRWGLDSLLLVKSLFLLSGIVTLFNPKFMAAMNDMMVQVAAKNPAIPAGQTILPPRFMEAVLAFSYAFGFALIIVMAIYRSRFLKAAAEAAR
jgi:hypothetical protein